ncbi:MAG: CoA-acylating methylmalonate-semialdehyde dehydrogenase [Gemmatimonadota bacterium]|nr:methylmalonate-semialdehyde dehydrogenase (CoA acylating) [Gemmatimonadota bacterium]MDP6529183.1 CoA-acylating methylmalonate-semialdehyde dehydrogenase [Gemmatimonadota bacterium]MDP6802872.1 CoA-acylating methylmalonate-semialdehyde dehydrogenase [Gemmatimonadota bacterium]MDP7032182.1 CoA-acylating methylmalonate-semialdehyde dehydrogenase [Gemmatimonadota bacterium]
MTAGTTPVRLKNLIAGRWTDSVAETTTPVFNPAHGTVQAEVPWSEPEEVDAAVRAAAEAYPAWRETPVAARARVLFAYRELVGRHAKELAEIVTSEHGKIITDAMGSVIRGQEIIDFACGIPTLLQGDSSELTGPGIDCVSHRQPLGVCVGITPFNFPAMVPMWMIPLAIGCGNTFVLKPSEKTPRTSERMLELLAEAGCPDGVVNLVHGGKETVEALVRHPQVRAVSSVGSTAAALATYRLAANEGKRVQALGGAKNHLVVMPDADLDMTVDSIIGAAYGSAGERCMAISVVVAVGDVAEPIRERLAAAAGALRTGPGMDPANDMGPLITAEHRDRVASFVDQGVSGGADLVVDGRGLVVPGHEDGFFLGPTLFDHVKPDMTIYTEEIFGPVLCMVRVPDFESALALVNAGKVGNGTALFTRSGHFAREYERRVEVGMVGINVPIPVPMAYYPFSGWKGSFFGDLHVHGRDGVAFYTETKVVTKRWPRPEEVKGPDFSFPQST